jgi:hypothetical protein
MKIFLKLLVLVALLMLSACHSLHISKVAEDFDKGSRSYFRMVRWNELDKTPLYFVDDTLRAEFEKRVKAAKDVQITDYRVKYLECRPEKGDAEVTVEWDYYIPPSIKLKTVEDPQKWRYIEEEARKGWILMTLLPEFK